MCYICGIGIKPEHASAECEHIVDAFTGIGIGSIIQESNCYKMLYQELDTFLNTDKTDKNALDNIVVIKDINRLCYI